MTADLDETIWQEILRAKPNEYFEAAKQNNFSAGAPVYYKDDELTLTKNQFIRENPDGTKWLVEVDDTEELNETIIKHLV